MSKVIETIILGLFVVRHFAERDDFVAQFVEVSGPFFDVQPGFGVIGLSAIASRHQSREHGAAAGCATGRCDESAVERESGIGKPLHVGRADSVTAVGCRVQLTLVIGEENDDVGPGWSFC